MTRKTLPSWISGLMALFLIAPCAKAVTDPLSSSFFPAMDTTPTDYPSNIWVTGPLAKVLQNTGTPGIVHWAVVYAMQNEFQSFQIHVQAQSGGISNLKVVMSDLVNAQTGTHISASSTDIVVYREAYQNITTKTSTAATYLNTMGFIPDILIPAIDPYYHQTTSAFPFTVAAGNNQSVWVDVHVPPNAPSGYYSGTATVESGNTTLATLPVVYAVWDWSMPSTASLPIVGAGFGYNGFCNIAYGGTAGCSAYPDSGGGSDGANTIINIDGAVQMLDNRWSMDYVSNIMPNSGSFATYDQMIGPLLNGTPAHVATILPGAKLTTIQISYSGAPSAAVWQNFATHFTEQGWFPRLFNYLCDEPPNGCSWATLQTNGAATHGYSTPIIPNLVTTDMADVSANNISGDIDWMVPIINNMDPQGGSLQRATYNTWLTGSSGALRRLGSYQSCESAGTCSNGTTGGSNATWPNLHVDGLPVANRAMEWMTFLHNQSFELYYNVDICDDVGNCAGNNPWVSVYYAGGNGDGTLIYPCPTATCGTPIPIWVPSMRLKMVRDGMQDYEYLNALTHAGQGAFVQQQITSWITNSYTFITDPSGLSAARQALGQALHQFSLQSSTSATTQANATDFAAVRVYPNPWRSDKPYAHHVTFDQLPDNAIVKIFTVSGHWVKTPATTGNSAVWDLTTESGASAASGIYIYLIKIPDGNTLRGKLAIVQ